ncbi:AraC family transcriptional regulator [Pseudoruegeria sp. SHC-113]|uniref:AraC family transcriptional regulator n=1 Tax=Pseudoruegeria sp. SHC-113 TaxID=2855439 RepID=UPI0021BACFF8|nr:AraC family transcriptional regulator [Pseudoruegeria sp. SHC-113]MCT8158869.1 AraC family transcriptional regulator [Pseudoruegeria sp. SHC-113]
MDKTALITLIANRTSADGLTETGLPGVQLFRACTAVPCAPAVYEPSVIAIVSGRKEAVLDGRHCVYDDSQYLCCPTSMPVQAGTPDASPDAPLYGVLVSLDRRLMLDVIMDMESTTGQRQRHETPAPSGFCLARWDTGFADALLRLLQLGESPMDTAVLGAARLRELYYAILKGEAGPFARAAFGAENAIARAIAHLSSHLSEEASIDEMAARAGMSRAVFHRKFKQATTLSPIQFVKSMRLNRAAMKIAGGMSVNAAALDVGYQSASQFSREFKRMYGTPPRQWSDAQRGLTGIA